MSDEEPIKEFDLGPPYGKMHMTETQFRNFKEMQGDNSHQQFMENRKPIAHIGDDGLVDEASAKQHMRRASEFTKMFEELALKRVSPGTGANIEHISFEKWRALQTDYHKARKEHGMSEFQALKEVGFQPLPSYIRKLTRQLPNGETKVIRPILVNEVGVRPNGTIVLLEDKMPGDTGGVVVGPHTGKGK